MSNPPTIGVLVPTNGSTPTVPPGERPIGRAATLLFERGIDVVFGDTVSRAHMSGFRVRENRWVRATNVPLIAVHDRYPSQIRAEQFEKIRTGLNGIPMGNSLDFTMLCRDKLASQKAFVSRGIRMPEVESNPDRFQSALQQWKSGFLKPQYGALGIGVQKVEPGDTLPTHTIGVVEHRPDPTILQAAIEPPRGWASQTVRVLIQRTPQGGWFIGTPVVRRSTSDPVANAARGAEVAAGPDVLTPKTLHRIDEEVRSICGALDTIDEAQHMVEAGIDLVLDKRFEPWLIEINSRPRGRMEVLAASNPGDYRTAHIEACARPLEVIAQWGS